MVPGSFWYTIRESDDNRNPYNCILRPHPILLCTIQRSTNAIKWRKISQTLTYSGQKEEWWWALRGNISLTILHAETKCHRKQNQLVTDEGNLSCLCVCMSYDHITCSVHFYYALSLPLQWFSLLPSDVW